MTKTLKPRKNKRKSTFSKKGGGWEEDVECSSTTPICLNRPLNKGIIKYNCDDEPYYPIDELQKLLLYVPEIKGVNATTMKPETRLRINREKIQDDKLKNCHDFSLAWFVVIKDIFRRFELITDNPPTINVPAQGGGLEEESSQLAEDLNKNIKSVDLYSLFRKILEIGKQRWAGGENAMARAILDGYAELLEESGAFHKFSEQMENFKFTPDSLKQITMDMYSIDKEERVELFEPFLHLFEYTIPMMNIEGDLTNSLHDSTTNNSEAIKVKFKEIKEYFENINNQNGGSVITEFIKFPFRVLGVVVGVVAIVLSPLQPTLFLDARQLIVKSLTNKAQYKKFKENYAYIGKKEDMQKAKEAKDLEEWRRENSWGGKSYVKKRYSKKRTHHKKHRTIRNKKRSKHKRV